MKVWVVTIDDSNMISGIYSNKALAGRAAMEIINYKYWYNDAIEDNNRITLEMYYEYVTDMWDDGITFTIETISPDNETIRYTIEPVTLNE